MGKLRDDIIEQIRPLEMPGCNFKPEDFKDESLCARAQNDGDTFRQAREVIATLATLINRSGNDHILRLAIIDEVRRTHRYLQNELIVCILTALGDLGKLAEDEPGDFSDARNEFSMKVLQKLRKSLRDELFWRD